MSHPHIPSYVRAIQAFLRQIGAFITKIRVGNSHRIVITWRIGRKHVETSLARHVADPTAYAARKMAEIKALAGLAGAAA